MYASRWCLRASLDPLTEDASQAVMMLIITFSALFEKTRGLAFAIDDIFNQHYHFLLLTTLPVKE
jgi:hypothetical protein